MLPREAVKPPSLEMCGCDTEGHDYPWDSRLMAGFALGDDFQPRRICHTITS